jgi:hypothetical protein
LEDAARSTVTKTNQTNINQIMKLTLKNPLQAKSCSFVAIIMALVTMAASKAAADNHVRVFNEKVSGVPAANPVVISPNVLSPEFTAGLVAQGLDLLENPSGLITQFGNLSDGSRTEPDENTYLILDHNPGGPTPDYDYGRHFLFQGHENANDLAHVTRINLDVADPDHRFTLLTPVDENGLTEFNSIDGSTWDPFSHTLLFTQEDGADGGVIEMGADFDPNTGAGAGLRTLYGSLGRGGYEGIHPDDWGKHPDHRRCRWHHGFKSWEESKLVRLPVRSYISERPDSWQIAGAPSLHQREPGRVRAGRRPEPERRHAVGESAAAPHGGCVLAGPMGHDP